MAPACRPAGRVRSVASPELWQGLHARRKMTFLIISSTIDSIRGNLGNRDISGAGDLAFVPHAPAAVPTTRGFGNGSGHRVVDKWIASANRLYPQRVCALMPFVQGVVRIEVDVHGRLRGCRRVGRPWRGENDVTCIFCKAAHCVLQYPARHPKWHSIGVQV